MGWRGLGCTDSAFGNLKLSICEQAPPNYYFKKYLGTNWCGRPMYSEIDVAKAIKL